MGKAAQGVVHGRAAEADALHRQQPLQQPIPQGAQGVVAVVGLEPFLGKGQGLGKTDGQHHRFRAAPSAPLLPSSADQGAQAQPRPQQQGTDPPGALEFVGGTTEQVHRELIQPHRQVTHHLNRIDMEQHPGLTAEATDRVDRLEGAHLVLTPDHGHQPGGRPQQGGQGSEIDHATPIHRHGSHLPTVALQLSRRRQGGGMFHGGDHQAPWLQIGS